MLVWVETGTVFEERFISSSGPVEKDFKGMYMSLNYWSISIIS